LELGTDFAFVARQKRITIDNEDYYIDLLFYHRRLRRLVAIDLKLGKFQAADKGQMELYLRWLEQHDVQPGEAAPLGLILCAEKSAEHVELLQLEEPGTVPEFFPKGCYLPGPSTPAEGVPALRAYAATRLLLTGAFDPGSL
jgi:hypothetical protein